MGAGGHVFIKANHTGSLGFLINGSRIAMITKINYAQAQAWIPSF